MSKTHQFRELERFRNTVKAHIQAGYTFPVEAHEVDTDVLAALEGERVERPSACLRLLGEAVNALSVGHVVFLIVDYNDKSLQMSTPQVAKACSLGIAVPLQ